MRTLARRWGPYAILLSVSAILAFDYYSQIDLPRVEERLALHGQIVGGTAPNPFRYRVLMPHVADLLGRALNALPWDAPQRLRPESPGSTRSFLLSYLVLDFATIAFALWTLFVFVRQWFTDERALVGALLAAATMPVTFRDHFFHPWSLLEIGLYCAALLLILRKRHGWLMFVIILGALNRETSCFLVLAFLFANLEFRPGHKVPRLRRDIVLWFVAYSAVWLIIFFGLHVILGWSPPLTTLRSAWEFNTQPQSLRWALLLNAMFFGLFWAYVVAGYRYAPAFIRKVSGILPFYAFLILVIGWWLEVRYLMTLYPILIPLGLSYLYPASENEERPAAEARPDCRATAEHGAPRAASRVT